MKTKFNKESEEECEIILPIVFASILDNRFGLEIERIEPYKGKLSVYDLNKDNILILERFVGIAYDAEFGSDFSDIIDWQQIVCDFIDFKYEK
jgi:hypothetical protein